MTVVTRHPVTPAAPEASPEFALMLGGPLFQLFRRSHLSGNALELVRARMLIIVAITWLPLMAGALADGHVLNAQGFVPFLRDVDANVRFLVALPLLIVAELVVHQRMRPVAQQFLSLHLVPDEALSRFESAIGAA